MNRRTALVILSDFRSEIEERGFLVSARTRCSSAVFIFGKCWKDLGVKVIAIVCCDNDPAKCHENRIESRNLPFAEGCCTTKRLRSADFIDRINQEFRSRYFL